MNWSWTAACGANGDSCLTGAVTVCPALPLSLLLASLLILRCFAVNDRHGRSVISHTKEFGLYAKTWVRYWGEECAPGVVWLLTFSPATGNVYILVVISACFKSKEQCKRRRKRLKWSKKDESGDGRRQVWNEAIVKLIFVQLPTSLLLLICLLFKFQYWQVYSCLNIPMNSG